MGILYFRRAAGQEIFLIRGRSGRGVGDFSSERNHITWMDVASRLKIGIGYF
ncbi:MAG TPA: hypothetical protein PLZ75_04315 [Bacteroidales bacterium]|jgi:hypothetical protein|nr:hypothetical protein [Bacteroidales bacterium]HQH23853.1 hypothetical protein [Bacteroidales bacterium]HQJ83149.1 hypothetical protein [Bacteroidales bacterium]